MLSLKQLIRLLLFASFLFLIYYLINLDYLALSNINFNIYFLLGSLILLWSGFFISTVSWRVSLLAHNINTSQKTALYSHGISVFAKYIPGKMWVVLGRAGIVSQKTNQPLILTSSVSLKEQLTYLFLGLIISLPTISLLKNQGFLSVVLIFTAMGTGLFLFVLPVHQFILSVLSKLLKKEINIPFVNIKETWQYGKIIILYWLLWSFGFYFLTKSIVPDVPVNIVFIFPLSVCYGLIAVFVPGGIGVREGIIVFLLKNAGIDIELAVSISVIQRLWFISGEVFIFVLALINKNQ